MGVYDLTEMGLDEGKEPFAVDPKEYELRIIDCKISTDKNGLEYILPRFEIISEPYSKDFTKFLNIPDRKEMDAKKLNLAQVEMSNFLTCFGFDIAQRINFSDDLPGATGWAFLGKKGSEDDEYGEQNFVKKFILPR